MTEPEGDLLHRCAQEIQRDWGDHWRCGGQGDPCGKEHTEFMGAQETAAAVLAVVADWLERRANEGHPFVDGLTILRFAVFDLRSAAGGSDA